MNQEGFYYDGLEEIKVNFEKINVVVIRKENLRG